MGGTIKHLIRYFLGLEPASSQTTGAERAALSRHATGRRRVVEIGVYEGLTSALLLRAMAAGSVLYAIDPFFAGRLGLCWGKFIARRETARVKSTAKIIFVEKLSFDALQDVPGELDFLFVDGDHSLEGIKRDWADWSPRMASGGIIALHDTRVPTHNPRVAALGSYQYFESYIRQDSQFEIIEQVDSLSILRRRDRSGTMP
jgi:predicted O-methyltransferase YrrM